MSLRNRAVLPVILFALAVLAGCGSSYTPPTPPPTGGFSNSNLKGTYVFSTVGSDSSGNFLAITGTLTADGNGNLTGGTFDENNPGNAGSGTLTVGSGSAYLVNVDGRGHASINTSSSGTFGFDFVLTSNEAGLITAYDQYGTGSGTLDLQSSVTQTALAGPYALGLTGTDGSLNFMSTLAGFTLDTAGTMSNGVQDINDSGTPYTSLSLGGTVLVGAAGAPGTAQLVTSTSLGTLTFDVFPIDASHLKFIETDGSAYLSGDAFPQLSSVPTGTNVFTLAGLDYTDTSPVPFVAGGFMVTDNGGNVTNASAEDINDAGNVMTQIGFTGLYGTSLTNGRTQVTLTGFNNGSLSNTTVFAAYPSAGGLQLLEIDGNGITSGVAYPQSATTLASSQGYGMNLTGSNAYGEEDDIAEFTYSGNSFSGLIDFNDVAAGQGLSSGIKFTSTYAADSSGSGRGAVTPGPNAFNLITYVVSSGTTVFVETDNYQVGLGSFGEQSASSKANFAQRHLAVLRLKPGSKSSAKRR